MNLHPPGSGAGRPSRREAAGAFAIATVLFMALNAWRDVRVFWFDAGLYWQLADLAGFTSVTNNIRGYVLAVLLAPARYLCELTGSFWPLRAGLSLAYAWGLTWLAPAAYTAFFGGRLSLARRLLPAVLMAVVFPGMLVHPMSDLPALLLMLGALLALHRAARRSGGLAPGWVALAGALAAAAYNVRTIYLFLLAGVLLAALAAGLRAPLRRQLAAAAAFAAAALAVLAPQGLLNQHMHGRFTFNPVVMGNGESLFVAQLVQGLGTQRYETMSPPLPGQGAVKYRDPAGERVLAEVGGPAAIRSPADYITRVVLGRPLDFAAVMGRHFVNGLDVRDGMVYVRRFSASRDGAAVVNFAVLASAGWAALLLLASPGAGPVPPHPPHARWPWWALLWLAPVAFILPGMVETRFFLPLHLLAWCVLAFHGDRRAMAGSARAHPVLVAAAWLGAAGLFFGVTLATMAQGPA